jgi:hypothetical protein
MCRSAFAFLLASTVALASCSAVDDFGKFHFADGGSGDMTVVDMTGAGLPGFGEACTTECTPGPSAPSRPLMCLQMFGPRQIPGGECTRACVAGSVISCTDYGDAVCAHVEGMDVCLRGCNPALGHNCRSGFDCCANQQPTTGPGACAPTNTDYCGH